jgi:hypothetical protein
MGGKHHKPSWWRRCRDGAGRVSRPRWSLIEMVDGDDGAHLVTSEAFGAGLREGTGLYQMLCGCWIAVGSMATRPDHCCRPCRVMEAWT